MVNIKLNKKNHIFRCLVIGLLYGTLIGMALVLLSSIFILNEYIEQSLIWLIAMIIHIIATFTIAIMCISKRQSSNTSVALIGIVVWFTVVLICGAIVFEGPFKYIISTTGAGTIGYIMTILMRYIWKKTGNRKGSKRKHAHIVHFNQ